MVSLSTIHLRRRHHLVKHCYQRPPLGFDLRRLGMGAKHRGLRLWGTTPGEFLDGLQEKFEHMDTTVEMILQGVVNRGEAPLVPVRHQPQAEVLQVLQVGLEDLPADASLVLLLCACPGVHAGAPGPQAQTPVLLHLPGAQATHGGGNQELSTGGSAPGGRDEEGVPVVVVRGQDVGVVVEEHLNKLLPPIMHCKMQRSPSLHLPRIHELAIQTQVICLSTRCNIQHKC
mmetsp:Transcript_69101/g.158626  ORF Transcript_69101/g.158626 Transcript_69101/m.158626 type:complete len:229 (+) Transcript_69101:2737-3423(+)